MDPQPLEESIKLDLGTIIENPSKFDVLRRDAGLVRFSKGLYLGWSLEGGHLRWAPAWLKRSICSTWNKVVCFLTGHERVTIKLASEEGPLKKAWAFSCCIHCNKTFEV
jgi:hypothetical protein